MAQSILIETVAVTGSTNADLLDRARSGAPEGLWLRAERQDAGRGRLGRQWQSPAGNLYASTIVRLGSGDAPAYSLAFVAALAVQATLSPFLTPDALMLKWPNDVLVTGQKICGMLLERSGDAVVIGIGINVTTAPHLPDRTVTCLADHIAGQGVTAALLIGDLARHFDAQLENWRTYGMAATLTRWQQHAHKPGERLTVTQTSGDMLSGIYAGLTDDGGLRLQSGDGSITLVHAGDVELIR